MVNGVDQIGKVSEVAGRRQQCSLCSCATALPTEHIRAPFRAFSVAGPTSWNSLPDDRLRDPTHSSDSFKKPLKTELFASYNII